MKAFVIMPFNDDVANDIYEYSTKPICGDFHLEVQRADEIFTANPILDDIVAAIEEASVIIADISGKNPNVFYELGMSHMLKRSQTIMITHEDFDKIPFDIAHFRIIKYENSIAGKSSYETQLRKTLENILRDYKSIYRNEFELMINVLLSANKEADLYALLALTCSPRPLTRYQRLHVEGHNIETGSGRVMISVSVEEALSTFVRLNYVEALGNMIVLSDKGKAFVDLLLEKGFACDFINGQILTQGYVPTHERMKQQNDNKLS